MGLGNSIISGFRRGVMGPIERPWEVLGLELLRGGARLGDEAVCGRCFGVTAPKGSHWIGATTSSRLKP